MTETASIAEKAEELAREIHAGQVYHGTDLDFVETHLEPIVGIICELGGSATQQAMGWLHDTVEDTEVSLADLAAGGIPPRVVSGVDILTKRDGVSREAYMWRVAEAEDPEVAEVKDVDSTDNLKATLRLERILDPEDFDDSVRSYAGNLIFLADRRKGRHAAHWEQFMAEQAEYAQAVLKEHGKRFGQTAVSLATGLPRLAY